MIRGGGGGNDELAITTPHVSEKYVKDVLGIPQIFYMGAAICSATLKWKR